MVTAGLIKIVHLDQSRDEMKLTRTRGLIEFFDPKSAVTALGLNGVSLGGLKITVMKALTPIDGKVVLEQKPDAAMIASAVACQAAAAAAAAVAASDLCAPTAVLCLENIVGDPAALQVRPNPV